MSIDIAQQREVFIGICQENIKRDGLEGLLKWFDQSDFYTAPASTKYHGAYAGGLCEHSLDVFRMAIVAKSAFGLDDLDMESVAIACLFHDLCKVNFYKLDERNQKVNGQWVKVPYYAIEEKFNFGGHGSKSVFLVQQFMRLKTDEAAAINCHMGFSDGASALSVSNAYHAFPLAWLIHIADEAATFLLDRNSVTEQKGTT